MYLRQEYTSTLLDLRVAVAVGMRLSMVEEQCLFLDGPRTLIRFVKKQSLVVGVGCTDWIKTYKHLIDNINPINC